MKHAEEPEILAAQLSGRGDLGPILNLISGEHKKIAAEIDAIESLLALPYLDEDEEDRLFIKVFVTLSTLQSHCMNSERALGIMGEKADASS